MFQYRIDSLTCINGKLQDVWNLNFCTQFCSACSIISVAFLSIFLCFICIFADHLPLLFAKFLSFLILLKSCCFKNLSNTSSLYFFVLLRYLIYNMRKLEVVVSSSIPNSILACKFRKRVLCSKAITAPHGKKSERVTDGSIYCENLSDICYVIVYACVAHLFMLVLTHICQSTVSF